MSDSTIIARPNVDEPIIDSSDDEILNQRNESDTSIITATAEDYDDEFAGRRDPEVMNSTEDINAAECEDGHASCAGPGLSSIANSPQPYLSGPFEADALFYESAVSDEADGLTPAHFDDPEYASDEADGLAVANDHDFGVLGTRSGEDEWTPRFEERESRANDHDAVASMPDITSDVEAEDVMAEVASASQGTRASDESLQTPANVGHPPVDELDENGTGVIEADAEEPITPKEMNESSGETDPAMGDEMLRLWEAYSFDRVLAVDIPIDDPNILEPIESSTTTDDDAETEVREALVELRSEVDMLEQQPDGEMQLWATFDFDLVLSLDMPTDAPTLTEPMLSPEMADDAEEVDIQFREEAAVGLRSEVETLEQQPDVEMQLWTAFDFDSALGLDIPTESLALFDRAYASNPAADEEESEEQIQEASVELSDVDTLERQPDVEDFSYLAETAAPMEKVDTFVDEETSARNAAPVQNEEFSVLSAGADEQDDFEKSAAEQIATSDEEMSTGLGANMHEPPCVDTEVGDEHDAEGTAVVNGADAESDSALLSAPSDGGGAALDDGQSEDLTVLFSEPSDRAAANPTEPARETEEVDVMITEDKNVSGAGDDATPAGCADPNATQKPNDFADHVLTEARSLAAQAWRRDSAAAAAHCRGGARRGGGCRALGELTHNRTRSTARHAFHRAAHAQLDRVGAPVRESHARTRSGCRRGVLCFAAASCHRNSSRPRPSTPVGDAEYRHCRCSG